MMKVKGIPMTPVEYQGFCEYLNAKNVQEFTADDVSEFLKMLSEDEGFKKAWLPMAGGLKVNQLPIKTVYCGGEIDARIAMARAVKQVHIADGKVYVEFASGHYAQTKLASREESIEYVNSIAQLHGGLDTGRSIRRAGRGALGRGGE